MLAAPSRWVVQPPGTLRFVPEGKKEMVQFCKDVKLRKEYLEDLLACGRDQASHSLAAPLANSRIRMGSAQ